LAGEVVGDGVALGGEVATAVDSGGVAADGFAAVWLEAQGEEAAQPERAAAVRQQRTVASVR